MHRAKTIYDEEGFEPCRDDRCAQKDDGIHPAHDLDKPHNNLPSCPLCASDLIKMRGKRARCAKCQWRGSIKEAQLGNKPDA